jgi:putative heme-binding domain-containing protein
MTRLPALLAAIICLIAVQAAGADPASSRTETAELSRAGNEQVAEIMRTFGGRGVMADDSPPTPAAEAVRQFQVREGFAIDLVAAEPVVSQPVFLTWDSRGRMWVMQYRQYQYPAGLQVIRFDQHLRAVFDKVPDPPPHGVQGRDTISVHEDIDGDGVYDRHKEVITGLNIATSMQVGNGAIWVLNPPYLLRYPDADRDDIPDSDPEVHLSGFGLQDTHAVANSLSWGPDGWLYGCTGSTTEADISSAVTKGVRFQGQAIWRYHPTTRVFEVYAEGGGNTFSLEIDAQGRIFTGTNGGDTRGWYFPQGSYAAKNWGKHGPLTNPYAFGFFQPMRFEGDGRRFPQAFCIYEGGLYPPEFTGTIIAPNALHNLVWNSRRIPDGSTYRTVDLPNLVISPDRWFRPVYAGVGPDGAVYLADWYDTRLSHVSPTDDWHKESGRIYRVLPRGSAAAYTLGDLRKHPSPSLIGLLSHPNRWVRQRATLELGWRNDPTVLAALFNRVESGSLEALWVVHLMGELSTDRAGAWLESEHSQIRRWTVRLLGDRHESHPGLAALAAREADVQVRSQLASSAKRPSAADALPVIRALLLRDEDAADPHQPLLVWWALEAHAGAWPLIEPLLQDKGLWSRPLLADHVVGRLMQRYAASGTPEELEHCGQMLTLAPDDAARERLLVGLERAFQGRPLPNLPEPLAEVLSGFQARTGQSGLLLGLRQRDRAALETALSTLRDRAANLPLQLAICKTLGEVPDLAALPTLLQLATGRGTSEPVLQRVAIQSLADYADEAIPKALLGAMGGSISEEHALRSTACRTLASRPAWASALLGELNAWRLRRNQIPPDVVQQLRAYREPSIVAAVEQAFGPAIEFSAPQKLAEMSRLKQVLRAASGDAGLGKELFQKRCGTCHQLFGEGRKVGPPLDGYERGNLNFWLAAIIEPSLEIREGFQSYLVVTDDGRALTGMIASQDSQTVTLRNADHQLTVISREAIEMLEPLQTSLMPENVLKDLEDGEIRDLFAYLTLGTAR